MPCTTWSLVTTYPLLETMKPEPIADVPRSLSTRMVTTLGITAFATPASDVGARWVPPLGAGSAEHGATGAAAVPYRDVVSERATERTREQRRDHADQQHLGRASRSGRAS